MIEVFDSPEKWMKFRKLHKLKSKTLGFVPTMGGLHKGHSSLILKALNENDDVLVSIFLNPTQFNNKSDLENYPKHDELDINILTDLGVKYLLKPSYQSLYPDNFTYSVNESVNSKILCGEFRPGHFQGVLTVVLKLLNIAQADNAYFGEKDYQQYRLIADMVDAFFIETRIISCPIIREDNGLALSTRNERLSENSKNLSSNLFKIISSVEDQNEALKKLHQLGFEVEYLTEKWNRRFVAAKIEDVRLIDNVTI